MTGHDVAVVTGAARGIGLAAAHRLGPSTRRLLVTDVDGGALADAARGLRQAGFDVHEMAVDLADAVDVERLAAAAYDLGSWSVLAHCAGLAPFMTDDGDRLLAVNLLATASLLDAFEKRLTGGEVAVCVASISAYRTLPAEVDAILVDPLAVDFLPRLGTVVDYAGRPRLSYALSKRGVQLLCRQRARRWGRAGARICSVSPGGAETRMAARSPLKGDDTAVGRRATPEEIASVIGFLTGPDAAYVTGSDVLVDGGAMAQYLHHADPEKRDRWRNAVDEERRPAAPDTVEQP
ncbi:SDR family oxidoreductase [Pseudonocardia xishanensis]|uniref:SDR family oxidoreductase n=1 Tax=Pseudonocardia xishanensis TaxID=630995 RepID=A0ABP8RJN2_9PSEU